ncbi:MAG TPA: hypothetical protein VJT71_14535 [Pyrinomonadaceae bacterium]|nr:hypothetical protein [Pyrinomonadaceae bacterium]
MKRVYLLFMILALLGGCTSAGKESATSARPSSRIDSKAPRNSATVIHVFVALCDNINQGIVPVAPSLGNGDDPARNLYWGAAFGIKTFFAKNRDWQLVTAETVSNKSSSVVLDRVVFEHRQHQAFLVAEAYRGRYIRQATEDFLAAAAGTPGEDVNLSVEGKTATLHLGGSANLVAYIGHNGLMDFQLISTPKKRDDEKRDAIILACASKGYFADALRKTGANPLVWTTNLMAPEAYVLSAAIDGWLKKENDEAVRLRAAAAYHKYQNCGLKSANRLFATGW